MAEQPTYNFKKIEKKWQDLWEKNKVFKVKESPKKKKYYVLEMFPYPSGSGLHMGHAFNYSIGDIYARFMRMNDFNVLYPMGFDALGLPAENAAIKANSHPKIFTEAAISNFIKQMKSLGLSYDWDRMLRTMDPEYYKWNQYFFLQFYKKGLVYRKKAAVNWCPKCVTVLANEQVHNGTCWRHEDTQVEIKHLEQWFIKTTNYVEELLDKIDSLNWPQRIKLMQKNWIGKSSGVIINFKVNQKDWPVFTTRPDTIFGVTFMVVSAQHPDLNELITKKQKQEVENFLKKLKSVSEKELEEQEKQGVFTGSYAINPFSKEKVPIYAGNFVLAEYGSGMIMAVPAHDQRDYDFAKKYGIPIKEVIRPVYGEPNDKAEFRRTISAVIYRKKDNKFLMVKWKKFGWISAVIGGIDEGESPQKAAEREVFEETGYRAKAVKKLGGEVESYFFAENKNVWRHRLDQPILLELIDDEPQKVSKEESDKLEVIWMNPKEVFAKMTHPYNLVGFSRFLGKQEVYEDRGVLINSEAFNGLKSEEAKQKIINFIEKNRLGKRQIQYKFRDWLVSRQRYWGTPIPIIYCGSCGMVPVPEKDLPVLLPQKVEFGKGNPLTTNKNFVEVSCTKCKSKAKRETDTMDTFFDSSWYFLRFTDNKNQKKPFDTKKVGYWLPVDQYIGGAEHATMHLIYARFFVKALRDLGFLSFDEPFTKLFNQGMLHGEDGFVMSKSRGNVILPQAASDKYGIDTARFFLMSLASPDKDMSWSDKGIEGSFRFIKKIMSYFEDINFTKLSSQRVLSKQNKTIKEVSEDITNFRYNLAIIKLRGFFDLISQEKKVDKKTIESFLKILHPFCPHLTEELWEKIGNKPFISIQKWPEIDKSKINEKFELVEKTIDQTVSDIINIITIVKQKQGKEPQKVYLYILPNEKENYSEEELTKRVEKPVRIYLVDDKNKYDPQNKASKAKPLKPGIFIE